jgi:hypothetical protein
MTEIKRNIGIIGDGRTDRIIFGKIVECILTEDTSKEFIDCNILELERQNLHDIVDKYWQFQKKQTPQKPQEIIKDVAKRLYQVFLEFANEAGEISNCDLLILTTDSEKVLARPEDYFSYGIDVFNILSEAVIKFYGTLLEQGYPQDNIPLILPIATFPSTEIIIAAAKGLKTSNYYGKKPSELKDIIYNKSSTPPTPRELEEKALKFITVKGIKNIFNNIPESRHFIKTLSCYGVSCYTNLLSELEAERQRGDRLAQKLRELGIDPNLE